MVCLAFIKYLILTCEIGDFNKLFAFLSTMIFKNLREKMENWRKQRLIWGHEKVEISLILFDSGDQELSRITYLGQYGTWWFELRTDSLWDKPDIYSLVNGVLLYLAATSLISGSIPEMDSFSRKGQHINMPNISQNNGHLKIAREFFAKLLFIIVQT